MRSPTYTKDGHANRLRQCPGCTSAHVRSEPGFFDLIAAQGTNAALQIVVAGFGQQPEVCVLL
ncbi:hypothetical protein WH7805_06096 [Synechococcus sp. WH 7805]|nr:hypothetical protein WH7805_06096 [Synechococcus sp. WH 7805]